MASGAALTTASVAMLLPALAVAGVYAAVLGVVTRRPEVLPASPLLLCAAWLTFATEALQELETLEVLADAARQLEEAGFDGAYTFEGRHDPFLPLAVAAEAAGVTPEHMTSEAQAWAVAADPTLPTG